MSTNTQTATLQLPDQTIELPIVVGTENEHGVVISKLRGQTATSPPMMDMAIPVRVHQRFASSMVRRESFDIAGFPLSRLLSMPLLWKPYGC